jgi:hypothetical protein
MTETEALCPGCAQAASGRFCSHCGTALEAPDSCADCGNRLPAGARFCNMCGVPALAERRDDSPASAPAAQARLPWLVAGGALVALIVVLLLPQLRGGNAPAATFAAGAAPASALGDARGVDLAAMTPREAADRLFNRVMQAVSSGDTAQAGMFLPMALGAYDRVDDLDLDGRYHVAVLHLVNSDPASANAQARAILEAEPTHLFGLFTAAQSEQELGRTEEARALFTRFLDHYDAELAAGRPEYTEHAPVLPTMREEAERATGG